MEWYQIHQTHVLDAIPFAPFQSLLSAILPLAASTVVCVVCERETERERERERERDSMRDKVPKPLNICFEL